MPRTKEQFSEMKDERKSSILKAALPLFSLNTKVSIDAICEKAKCSHGIVYHYFRNTDQILDTLLKSPTYVELTNKLFSSNDGSSYEKLEDIVRVLLEVSNKNLEYVCYLNMLIKERDKNSLFSLLCKIIKEGQASGTLVPGEPSEIVESIFFLLKGVYLSLLLEKHPDVRVPSLETVMQLIRKPTSFYRQIL